MYAIKESFYAISQVDQDHISTTAAAVAIDLQSS